MSDFFNPLPYEIEYQGARYKLTPAFDNVLNMYEQIKGVNEFDRPELMMYYLTDNAPVDMGLLSAILDLLLGKAPKTSGKAYFSYTQDAQYIYSAFMQTYGIDLIDQRGKMHWWKFNALLSGLPDTTKFCQIVQIRQKPLPKPNKHNQEEIANLLRLKSIYRLEMSEEERKNNLQEGLNKVLSALLSMGVRHE